MPPIWIPPPLKLKPPPCVPCEKKRRQAEIERDIAKVAGASAEIVEGQRKNAQQNRTKNAPIPMSHARSMMRSSLSRSMPPIVPPEGR